MTITLIGVHSDWDDNTNNLIGTIRGHENPIGTIESENDDTGT